jgi:hypothetical protein
MPADPHLHRAAPAVVEPVAGLLERPQYPLPKHWTAPGEAGIKSLQNASQGAGSEGPGSDVNRESRAFVYLSPGRQHNPSTLLLSKALHSFCRLRRQTARRVKT